MPGPAPKPAVQRFAAFVNLDGPIVRPELGPCHLWTGAVSGNGYGVFGWSSDERAVPAHRAAWRIAKGEIPDGVNVLHRCDTPLCVNTDHHFLGTQADNMADRLAKGRWAGGRPPRLSEEQRDEVRARRASGEGLTSLAHAFGVSKGSIQYTIANAETAPHV